MLICPVSYISDLDSVLTTKIRVVNELSVPQVDTNMLHVGIIDVHIEEN